MPQISKKLTEEGLRLIDLIKARFEEARLGDCSRATVHFFNLLDRVNKTKAYQDIRRKREREEEEEASLT